MSYAEMNPTTVSKWGSSMGDVMTVVQWYFDHPSYPRDPFITTYPDGSDAPTESKVQANGTVIIESIGLAAGLLWTQTQRTPDGHEKIVTVWQPVDHASYRTAPDHWGDQLLQALQESYPENAAGPGNTAWWGGIVPEGGSPNSWPFGPRDWVMANRGGLTQAEIDAAPMDEWGGGAHSAYHLKYGGHAAGGDSLMACAPVAPHPDWIWPP